MSINIRVRTNISARIPDKEKKFRDSYERTIEIESTSGYWTFEEVINESNAQLERELKTIEQLGGKVYKLEVEQLEAPKIETPPKPAPQPVSQDDEHSEIPVHIPPDPNQPPVTGNWINNEWCTICGTPIGDASNPVKLPETGLTYCGIECAEKGRQRIKT